MKTIPIALASHMAGGTTTLAHALSITRTDGQAFGFTSAVENVTFEGLTYSASQGLNVSRVETSAGLSVDNLELSTLDDGTLFNRADIFGGVWTNAAFRIIRYNYNDPGAGYEVILVGTVGEVKINNGVITAELRGLTQRLQQNVGSVLTKTCRARFADAKCTKSAAAFTVTGTITTVASNKAFADTSRTEAADWFAEGIVTFTSGALAGTQHKVSSFLGGVFTLNLPPFADLAVGMTYSAIAGCRKRLEEDCRDKFNNVLNFQGEPHIPGLDKLTSSPD